MRPNFSPRLDLLITCLLISVPILLFTAVWMEYAVNIPHWDDFVLKWLPLVVERQTEIKGSIYQFFKQHNEHRIVYDRVIAYLDYKVFGKINFLHLMAIGNLSLLGLPAIYGAELRRSGRRLLYLVPLAFVLFNLSQWENMFWGMAALQNFTVVLWVLWAVHGLTHWMSPRSLIVTFGLGVLATLTSGNGLLIWPIGIILLLLQRRWTYLIRWFGGAIIIVVLYFIGYIKPSANPRAGGNLIDLLNGWMAFIGSAGEIIPLGSPLYTCTILGTFLTVCVIVVLYVQLTRDGLTSKWNTVFASLMPVDLFFLGSVCFIFATGLVVVFSRIGFGLDILITSRYKIYSFTLLSVIYVWIVIRIQRNWRQTVGILGTIAAVTLAYLSYVKFLDRAIYWHQYRTTSQFNWTYSTNTPKSALDSNTIRLINNAPAFYDRHLIKLYATPINSSRMVAPIDTQRHTLLLVSNDGPNLSNDKDAGIYIGLRSAQRRYIFNTERHLNSSIRAELGFAPQFRPGFSFQLTENQVDAGTYTVELLFLDANGNLIIKPSNQIFVATPQRYTESKKNW